jgi:hypothetical protein
VGGVISGRPTGIRDLNDLGSMTALLGIVEAD